MSYKPILVGFNVVGFFVNSYVVYLGFLSLMNFPDDYVSTNGTSILWVRYELGLYQIWFMMAYQLWNTLFSCVVKEYRTTAALSHHVAGVFICAIAVHDYCHYHTGFFIGLSEMSTIPLSLVDLFKYIPSLAKRFPTVELVAKLLFAGLFLFIRCFLWPTMSVLFWRDNIVCVLGHTCDVSELSTYQLTRIFLLSVGNLFLTFLQFFWGKKLIKMIQRALNDKKKNKKDS